MEVFGRSVGRSFQCALCTSSGQAPVVELSYTDRSVGGSVGKRTLHIPDMFLSILHPSEMKERGHEVPLHCWR
ncbi:unnamed protein product, partial [Onchocerca ochengi]|uniref:Uncharacterized protein n=1 Tax=Onchocerca ochengi TaxID=42157 RepID=A0A182EKP6_ONCOC